MVHTASSTSSADKDPEPDPDPERNSTSERSEALPEASYEALDEASYESIEDGSEETDQRAEAREERIVGFPLTNRSVSSGTDMKSAYSVGMESEEGAELSEEGGDR